MVSQESIDIVKSTVPLLKEHGSKITATMYKNMFTEHPEVRSYFNNSHVRGDPSIQAVALGGAVLAYAENIDNLEVLGPAVENMVEKHVSFYVLPDHYKVVAKCLLGAMKEVLGEDVVTDAVNDAWGEAYWFLANLLIEKEKKVREARAALKGGWEGYEPFVITKKVKESENVTSFYLQNARNLQEPIIDFKSGQYLSLKIPQGKISGFDFDLARNYSISSRPGESFLRISVKREDIGGGNSVAGAVSSYLHNDTKIGTNLLVGVPCGVFVLDENNPKDHIVLLSAGVGITPLISMVEHAMAMAGKEKKVTLIQSVRSPEAHPMKDRIDGLAGQHSNFESIVFYSQTGSKELKNSKVFNKRLEQDDLQRLIPDIDNSCFYFCGPDSFQVDVHSMLSNLGVAEDQLNNERFNPGSAF